MHLSILGFSEFCLRESSWEVWNLTGVEMGTHLWETLRSLCLKTQWKYAVFWRLRHRDRKILTWEDTYYDNKELTNHSENMCCIDTVVDLPQGGHQQDLLGLTMAKMSYTIYPLGEGVIGKVAASGTHKWNFADKSASSCWSSSEYCDGWQAQFSAGIRTVAVVAVTPIGVVQLGSLDTVSEDLDLVAHIKEIFCSLQSSSMGFRPKSIQYTMKTTPCLPEIPAKSSDEIFHECRGISDEVVINIKPDKGHDSLPVFGKFNSIPHVLPLSDLCPKEAVEIVDKHVRNEPLTLQVGESARFIPQGVINLQMKMHSNKKCGEETNGWKDVYMSSRHNYPPAPHLSCTENTNLYNDILESVVHVPIQPVDSLVSMAWEEVNRDRMICLQNEGLHAHKTFEMQLGGTNLEQQFNLQTKIKHVDVDTLLRLSDGCEVHEALSAANDMQERHHFSIEAERGEIAVSIEPPGGRCSGQSMPEFGSENLLEAVSANEVSNRIKNESSVCESSHSIVTTEKSLQVPIHAKHTYISAVGPDGESSTVEDANDQLTPNQHLGEAQIRSQKELSSKILRTRPRGGRSDQLRTCHDQQSGREVEPAKVSKKRARAGETFGTRPRDRQLIADRIKELRELVPNGKKCSIDLLLGHTIKHMLFLQSITEYAKKLRKCDESMVHEHGDRHLHGSSWALELGSQTLRPMVVENLNMNGQMLVEMICNECSLFFDIGDALIGLGLTILKGATEIRGEKMWACFIVEGDKGIHRMDILWSLMLLLQSRSTI